MLLGFVLIIYTRFADGSMGLIIQILTTANFIWPLKGTDSVSHKYSHIFSSINRPYFKAETLVKGNENSHEKAAQDFYTVDIWSLIPWGSTRNG